MLDLLRARCKVLGPYKLKAIENGAATVQYALRPDAEPISKRLPESGGKWKLVMLNDEKSKHHQKVYASCEDGKQKSVWLHKLFANEIAEAEKVQPAGDAAGIDKEIAEYEAKLQELKTNAEAEAKQAREAEERKQKQAADEAAAAALAVKTKKLAELKKLAEEQQNQKKADDSKKTEPETCCAL